MSTPCLPQDISDYVVDLLHDQPTTLKRCCLVSRSWIHPTRKHLFAEISFRTVHDIKAWKQVFPDPAKSPAYYARSMRIDSMKVIVEVVTGWDGWIRVFRNVVKLQLQYVNMMFLSQQLQVFSLISSLPVLEDLHMRFSTATDHGGGRLETALRPFNKPPPLTGTLKIYEPQPGFEHFIRRLSDQLNGLRFRSIECMWGTGWYTITPMGACSNALEYVDVRFWNHRSPSSTPSIDFSEATKLKKVTFRSSESSIVWITMALRTITPEHEDFREVSIHTHFDWAPPSIHNPANTERTVGGEVYRQWMELDNLLVRLGESHGVGVMVRYYSREERGALGFVHRMLPEITKRGSTTLDYGYPGF